MTWTEVCKLGKEVQSRTLHTHKHTHKWFFRKTENHVMKTNKVSALWYHAKFLIYSGPNLVFMSSNTTITVQLKHICVSWDRSPPSVTLVFQLLPGTYQQIHMQLVKVRGMTGLKERVVPYHFISREPVSLLLHACLWAFAAHCEGLHHESILHSQHQLPGSLLGMHPIHPAKVPAQY